MRGRELVLEVAILNVRAGQSASFEAAFAEAEGIIAAAAGYQRHELRRCVEHADRYLLLVWWDGIESHTVGFRGSAEYQEWKRLLHHFYDPFPEVEHYLPAALTGSAERSPE
jgi:heme-degrading monooxygenase HmoA